MGRGTQTARDQFSGIFGERRGADRHTPQHITVTNQDTGQGLDTDGRSFVFRVIYRSGHYGREEKVLHDDPKPLIEVFDATYAGQGGFEPQGQIVSQYFLDTLRERPAGTGLDLHGGVDAWKVDAEAMREVYDWLIQL